MKEIGSLDNKYIVSLLGLDVARSSKIQDKPAIRIFMEYCDGKDLKHFYEESRKKQEYVTEKVKFFDFFCLIVYVCMYYMYMYMYMCVQIGIN